MISMTRKVKRMYYTYAVTNMNYGKSQTEIVNFADFNDNGIKTEVEKKRKKNVNETEF